METEKEMHTLPCGPQDRLREKALSDRTMTYRPGSVLIGLGQSVEMLFQVLEGTVDVIRDLGASDQKRERFSREATEQEKWGEGNDMPFTPILGGRYFFTKRPSSLRYVAVTPCAVSMIAPVTIRKKYADRDCRKLVRELIRNSDMPIAMFHEELDRRYHSLLYAGFLKEKPETLLGGEEKYVRGDARTRAQGEKLMREAYLDFACEMIFRLMGDLLKTPDDGSTGIGFDPPPVLR